MTAVEVVALFLLASSATAIECLVRYAAFRGRVRWGPKCWLHIVVNGAAAVGVLWLLRTFGLEVGSDSEVTQRTAQVAGAGFGALAILRSATFARRIEADAELPDQLASVSGVVESARHLLAFLVTRADEEMRERFDTYLTNQAQPLLDGWTYANNGNHIGALCRQLAAMEDKDSAAFSKKLKEIEKMDLPDAGKALLMVRICIRFAGAVPVSTAIDTITKDPGALGGAESSGLP